RTAMVKRFASPAGDQQRSGVDVVTATIGLALVAAALAANQRWLDRHFLPSFFLPRPWYVRIETAVRVSIAAVGIVLVVARSRIGRVIAGAPRSAVYVVLAAALAIPTAEVALRWIHLRPTEWLLPAEEPQRQPDARLGWVLVPGR